MITSISCIQKWFNKLSQGCPKNQILKLLISIIVQVALIKKDKTSQLKK
jgi:hypothetical protein